MENSKARLIELLAEVNRIVAALVTSSNEVPIEVAENGGLVVRADSKTFVCPMSKKQNDFLRELLRCDGKMDGNAIEKWVPSLEDRAIRNFVKSVNRKLRAKKMPTSISFVDWIVSIRLVRKSAP